VGLRGVQEGSPELPQLLYRFIEAHEVSETWFGGLK